MAVIAISRQVAALGDEIAEAAAKRLGYTFITRKQIEQRIIELGFSEKKMASFDERKPGFFASLSKSRDEYLNYLQYAIFEAAAKNNCILIGRGAFIILEGLPNLISLRFVANDQIRAERLHNEFGWDEKKCRARIEESANNRHGFHKSFFNIDHEAPEHFMLTINTGLLTVDEVAMQIEGLTKFYITPEDEKASQKRIANLLKAQDLVNKLLFEYKLNLNFLHAEINEEGDAIVLQGVADSKAIVERAVQLAAKILPSCSIKSAITVVQDFKN